MIVIDETQLCEMIAHCKNTLPEEACGVLIGSEAAGTLRVDRVIPITNAAERPEHAFKFDPSEWVRLILSFPSSGSKCIVGVYHSHPTTMPVPSSEDLMQEHYGFSTYWIVSLLNPVSPEFKAYHTLREDGRLNEIPIRVNRKQTAG